MKFAAKQYDITRLTLGMLLHYLGKLKIQIFCIYSALKKLHTNCILSAPIFRCDEFAVPQIDRKGK